MIISGTIESENGLCQRKVTFRGTPPALAFSDEKSVPLFQDFTGHHPTRRLDVRSVSAVFETSRGLAPPTWDRRELRGNTVLVEPVRFNGSQEAQKKTAPLVTRKRDRHAALKFLKKQLKRYRTPEAIVTDRLASYRAALRRLGIASRQDVGRNVNNRAENSHLPFRRRERAMLGFRSRKTLQKFTAVQSAFTNHFNLEQHLYKRSDFKANRDQALRAWRQISIAL